MMENRLLNPNIKRITNNAKVTDHHAILPTVQLEKQDITELLQSEQRILSLVGMRLLAATGEKHIYDETQITLSYEGYEFKSKSELSKEKPVPHKERKGELEL